MIKIFKKFWHKIDDYNDEFETSKGKCKDLIDLYDLLKQEFSIMTIEEAKKLGRDIDFFNSSKEFRIENCKYSYNKKNIKEIAKNFPNSTIDNYYREIGIVRINIDYSLYCKRYEKLKGCKIKDEILIPLKKIMRKLELSKNQSFSMLLDKYDSVFATLHMTILEMIESNTLDLESEQTIINILQAFIDEFNSLEAVFNKRIELDQEAIKDSLKRRLEDELTLVNKIKTNWNGELVNQEVKIEI